MGGYSGLGFTVLGRFGFWGFGVARFGGVQGLGFCFLIPSLLFPNDSFKQALRNTCFDLKGGWDCRGFRGL